MTVHRIRFLPAGETAPGAKRTHGRGHAYTAVADGLDADLTIAVSDRPEPAWPYRLTAGGVRVEWDGSRARIAAPADLLPTVIDAFVEFHDLHRELLDLETSVRAYDREATDDAKTTFVAHHSRRAEWPRIRDRIVRYTELRLRFAELEPYLTAVPRKVPAATRRWVNALLRKSDLAFRAEVLTGVLETREDLYEGASDRISDYSGWRYGHMLEIIIIVLLVIEATFMALDLVLRGREG